MLRLYQSNELEQLVDLLAATLSEPLPSPLSTETVVVPHPGMGQWLSLRLAERLGICANTAFPLPAGFIWEIFRAVLGRVPEHNPFEPAVLGWRILALLEELKGQPAFKPVSAYLADGSELKRYELACRIAETFDQYLLYRPDWIRQWEAGRPAVAGDDWQAMLWRRLSGSCSGRHWVELQQQLHRALLMDDVAAKLPERAALFGISTLSPGYLKTLHCLSERMDIHLFLLNPCAVHWTEIVDETAKARSEEECGEPPLYLEVGHPLLASLGRQGRDFFAALLEYDPGTLERFVPPENANLLGQLQQDIYNLHDRTAGPRQPFPREDRSLQFHSCHSVMREVEVLKDQLLELFQNDERIEPSDVLVMAPDITAYAPHIEAAFSTTGATAIPFQITDKSAWLETPLIAGFFNLLQIGKSRFDSGSTMALLETAAVQRRFGLAENDLDPIMRWVRESGIRWGLSGAERAQLGLPGTDQNSWRAGLDRMLLGYALPGDGTRLFQGVLPYDEIEGADAARLGALDAFIDVLRNFRNRLQGRYCIDAWGRLLLEMIEAFFIPSEQEELQLQQLRDGIEALCHQGQRAGFTGEIPLEVIHRHLKARLARGQGGGRGGGHGVRFCSLASMRGLPYKVIALIGMNDGDFPRQCSTPGFDLMAKRFRPGDRVRRADDGYLFLETLLCARHTLYISFIGQHIRDNSRIPPSGLVDELLDYLDRCYSVEHAGGVREQAVVHHPLQPFSRRYFQPGSGISSYSEAMYQAYRANRRTAASPAPFLKRELPEPDPAWRHVELAQLARFFSHPARYFLQQRLAVYYEREEASLETTEPFLLDYFARCRLNQSLVDQLLAGESRELLRARLRAAGALPHGRFGDRLFERHGAIAEKFTARLRPHLEATRERVIEVDLPLKGMRLCGRLSGHIGETGQFGYSVHSLWASQRLELWIKHLVLNVVKPSGIQRESRWMDDKKLYTFSPVDSAERHLEELLELYWQGLCRPLHFFPKSSAAYVQHRLSEKSIEASLEKAKQTWTSKHSEGHDPYYRLAFLPDDIFNDEFIALSERVYRPLLMHLQST